MRLSPVMLLVLGLLCAGPLIAADRDIVVVIDNSGSMSDHDPGHLARSSIDRLVNTAEDGDRIAIIVFDTDVRVAMPLTVVDAGSRARLLDSLDAIDYSGPWTDIPGAVERALYLLRAEDAPGRSQDILLVTDGIVDTGDATRDRDREAWLLDELVPLARESGVRIFGIAFSDQADYRLIQALSSRTGAEYARALDSGALTGAFDRLQRAMEPPPPEPVVVTPEPEPEPEPTATIPPSQPTTETMPTPAPEPESANRWLLYLGLALAVLFGAGAYLWFRRRTVSDAGVISGAPGATLTDRTAISGRDSHRIDTGVTVFGRKATDDLGPVTNIVIPQHTVSRLHASIRWRDGQYWLVDHDSANGTWLDDEPVRGEEPLHDGANIRIDTFDFDFNIGAPDVTEVRGTAAEEDEEDRTVVRSGAPATPTVFKTDIAGEESVWDDIDDEDIDTVLTEYEDRDRNR